MGFKVFIRSSFTGHFLDVPPDSEVTITRISIRVGSVQEACQGALKSAPTLARETLYMRITSF